MVIYLAHRSAERWAWALWGPFFLEALRHKRASGEFPSSLLGAVAPDRVNRIPLLLAHRLLADVRQTRGRRVEDTIKTVADVEDAGK